MLVVLDLSTRIKEVDKNNFSARVIYYVFGKMTSFVRMLAL